MKNPHFFSHIHQSHRTLTRYFLSYFILLSFLLIGFSFIVRGQLSATYLDMLNQEAGQQLENIKNQLSADLTTVSRVNSALEKNINLTLSRHIGTSWNGYLAAQEINSYALANESIQCIVYYDHIHDMLHSSEKYVDYTDGVFRIYKDGEFISFDSREYEDCITNQLILAGEEGSSYLLYYPCADGSRDYTLFYILNEVSISNMLKSVLSEEIISLALVNSEGDIAVGINDQLLTPHLGIARDSGGIYPLDSQTSLHIRGGLYNDFTITALVSDKAAMERLNAILSRTYLILFFLGITGLFIVLFSMRRTYLPLRNLARKIVKNPSPGQGYLEQLDLAFSATASENQNLRKKIAKYRLSMQKSIFDSMLASRQSPESENFIQMDNGNEIDAFFTMEPDNLIFALRIGLIPPLTRFPGILYADCQRMRLSTSSTKPFPERTHA